MFDSLNSEINHYPQNQAQSSTTPPSSHQQWFLELVCGSSGGPVRTEISSIMNPVDLWSAFLVLLPGASAPCYQQPLTFAPRHAGRAARSSVFCCDGSWFQVLVGPGSSSDWFLVPGLDGSWFQLWLVPGSRSWWVLVPVLDGSWFRSQKMRDGLPPLKQRVGLDQQTHHDGVCQLTPRASLFLSTPPPPRPPRPPMVPPPLRPSQSLVHRGSFVIL